MNNPDQPHRLILERIAHRVMLEKGLLPEFSPAVMREVDQLPTQPPSGPTKDLRQLLWSSIDNDDSLDLDQLTFAEELPGGRIRLLAAIADVDCLVKIRTAIDEHAHQNTTSIYTAAKIFPMLPERLSTDLTSLNLNQDRRAIVIEIIVEPDGTVKDANIFQALVHNQAKLAYPALGDWLEDSGPLPEAAAKVPGMAENLRLQDQAAQRLQTYRHTNGALSLRTLESRPVFEGDQIRDLAVDEKNRAKELIENIMIAANGVTARYLAQKKFPLIRRVVRTPKRWDRIVALAAEHDWVLPAAADAPALEAFLTARRAADPLRFPDLSLSVVKLLGAGEYVAGLADESGGHFGLAVRDYAHSTAPNRRYTDLVTHRLLRAAIEGKPVPYEMSELNLLAQHCTRTEDLANKVERQINKSAAALLLRSRIGEQFEALVTGAASKGTWVRLLDLPVEGRLMQGFEGLDVGDRLRVQLLLADVEKGFIDFKRAYAGRKR